MPLMILLPYMYKCIAFDLFGTLFTLDEAISKDKVLRGALEIHEYDVFRKHWLDWHKNIYSVETFLSNINKELDFKLDQKKIDLIRWRITLEKPELFKDTLPALESLKSKHFELILLTNSPPTAKEIFEKDIKLAGLFKSTVWSFEIGFTKPDKEAFSYMVQRSGYNVNEILYVGDSYEEDYLGPKNYGLNTLLVDRSGKYPLVEDTINTLSEINKYI